jgi:hypothetical protein
MAYSDGHLPNAERQMSIMMRKVLPLLFAFTSARANAESFPELFGPFPADPLAGELVHMVANLNSCDWVRAVERGPESIRIVRANVLDSCPHYRERQVAVGNLPEGTFGIELGYWLGDVFVAQSRTELVVRGRTDAAYEPGANYSGLWSVRRISNGLHLLHTGNRIAGIWFGHGIGGEPRWLRLEGAFDRSSDTFDLTLHRHQAAKSSDTVIRTAGEPVGRALLKFETPDGGTLSGVVDGAAFETQVDRFRN